MVERRMTSCSQCSREIPVGTVWCIHCGERARNQPERIQVQCQHCNATNSHDNIFCQSCGSALNNGTSGTGAYTQQGRVSVNQGSSNTSVSIGDNRDDTIGSIAMGNWSIAPLVGSILGALVLVVGVSIAESDVNIAAAAALAAGLAVIPYVFARAISEFQTRNKK